MVWLGADCRISKELIACIRPPTATPARRRVLEVRPPARRAMANTKKVAARAPIKADNRHQVQSTKRSGHQSDGRRGTQRGAGRGCRRYQGSTKGLLNNACIKAPDRARLAPIRRASIIRGRRRYNRVMYRFPRRTHRCGALNPVGKGLDGLSSGPYYAALPNQAKKSPMPAAKRPKKTNRVISLCPAFGKPEDSHHLLYPRPSFLGNLRSHTNR